MEHPHKAARSSWEKLSWWFAAAWLPFLAFPMGAVFTRGFSASQQVIATAAIVVFAGVYLWGFHRHPVWLVSSGDRTARMVVLALLVALVVVTMLTIGPHGLGLFPFVVAWSSFGMAAPWRWGVGAVTLTILGMYGTQGGQFSSMLWLMVINVAVILTGYLTSHLVNRNNEIRELEHAHLLVAERDRFARDVHDLLGHSLTMVGLKVQLAQRLIDEHPDLAKIELDDANHAIKDALTDVRRTVEGVRATTFTDSLQRATDTLVDAALSVDVVGDPTAVTGKIAIPLGWVVQELATNVLRHAGASEVTISVDDEHFVFEDNGVGVGHSRDGHGLRGMRERLTAAGADLSISTGSGGGTKTVVTW